jgi:menaquinone-dependent protoporphyrinogen oxidase
MLHHRILIVYGTSYGHTATIAWRLADVLTRDGFHVTVTDVTQPAADLDPAHFDSVIVGGSVIGGHHRRELARFVIANLAALRRLPAAFFSVSGSAAGTDAKGHHDAQECLDKFLRDTDWTPELTGTFGGAMAFTKYSWFMRLVMKQISRRAGGPTDTSRDHDLTNWHQVEDFAHAFGQLIEMPEPALCD